jgi:uncharacterized protein (DUF58 family)
MMAGHYRSAFRGAGMEFEEVREYAYGDEVKSVDWKVTARMGRPYVKMYREERELVIMLVVDLSASGRFGTTGRAKRDLITEAAAILAVSAIRSGDKVGAVLFTDRIEKYIPPKKGSAHVWRVIKEVLTFQPAGRGTDLTQAAEFLAKVTRKKCVAFIISDFLTGRDDTPALKRAARRHDVVAGLVDDPGDYRLPPGGMIEIQDPETGGRIVLDAFDGKTRAAFAQAQAERRGRIETRLKSARIDRVDLSTAASPADAWYGFFRLREKRLGLS